MVTPAVALTIAGSDSSGGAGIVADLKTFEAHGVWGAVTLTAVTAQNTRGVQCIEAVAPALVVAQIESVVTDLSIAAAKTGMLPSPAAVDAVLSTLPAGIPLVVDPVLASSTGEALSDLAVVRLVARAAVVTPNREEAAALTGLGEVEAAARALVGMGARLAMVTGGETARDCIVTSAGEVTWIEGPQLKGPHTHGTGCVLSAAIAAELALGSDLLDACRAAKRFVERSISAGLALGRGVGPVNPGWARRAT